MAGGWKMSDEAKNRVTIGSALKGIKAILNQVDRQVVEEPKKNRVSSLHSS